MCLQSLLIKKNNTLDAYYPKMCGMLCSGATITLWARSPPDDQVRLHLWGSLARQLVQHRLCSLCI